MGSGPKPPPDAAPWCRYRRTIKPFLLPTAHPTPFPQDKPLLDQLKAVAVKKLHRKNMVSKNDIGSFSAIKYLMYLQQ